MNAKPNTKPFPRIDSLKPGTRVTLAFHMLASIVMERGGRVDEEESVFQGIEGIGDDRRAKFSTPTSASSSGAYEWEAYRMNGRWVFGSSAERLQLIAVHE